MKTQKFILVFVLTIIMTAVLQAQNYHPVSIPDSGAIWSEEFYYSNATKYYTNKINDRFATNGEDTVIDGKTYTKLFLLKDTVLNPDSMFYIGAFRQDSGKVYYHCDSVLHNGLKPNFWGTPPPQGEYLMYDFSLAPGDTFHSEICGGLIVDSIDTIELGGVLRKKIHFLWGETWIEGIGDINTGFLRPWVELTKDNFYNLFYCFLHNGEIVYKRNSEWLDSCFFKDEYFNPNSDFDITGIKLYPNPSGGVVTVEYNNTSSVRMKIYNVMGTLLVNKQLHGKKRYKFDLSEYGNGVYFYVITSENDRKIKTGKIVVSK